MTNINTSIERNPNPYAPVEPGEVLLYLGTERSTFFILSSRDTNFELFHVFLYNEKRIYTGEKTQQFFDFIEPLTHYLDPTLF